jgi:hypothetical protein
MFNKVELVVGSRKNRYQHKLKHLDGLAKKNLKRLALVLFFNNMTESYLRKLL